MKWIEGKNSFANISADGKYRFSLLRKLNDWPNRAATFIMLNPSTADATTDDHTIRKCLGFCELWKCGELNVVNLFSVRATNPKVMKTLNDPVGPHPHAYWFENAVKRTLDYPNKGIVVCAWGNDGAYMDQDLEVMGWLDMWDIRPMCLGITDLAQPRHPCYLSYATKLIPYMSRRYRVANGKSVLTK